MNTSDPASHQEGVGTSDDAAHGGTAPRTGSAPAREHVDMWDRPASDPTTVSNMVRRYKRMYGLPEMTPEGQNIPLCVNDRRKPPSAAVILGRVVEAGNVACLDGRPGLVIETTEAQLRDFGRNAIGCEVEIGARADTGGQPRLAREGI